MTFEERLADIKDNPEAHIQHGSFDAFKACCLKDGGLDLQLYYAHIDLWFAIPFESVEICCMENGALDLQLLDAHADLVNIGSNGGTRCDVTSGPCACGAWH
jgi:hypothetical protein